MRFGGFVVTFVCMIMFLEFMGIPTGASAILSSFGIEINPITGDLISADGESGSFFQKIFGENVGVLVILSIGGAVIVGLFAKSFDTSLVILPVIVFIGTLLSSTTWIIIKYTSGFGQAWATNIVAMIMVGMWIAFIMSCMDYFAGR